MQTPGLPVVRAYASAMYEVRLLVPGPPQGDAVGRVNEGVERPAQSARPGYRNLLDAFQCQLTDQRLTTRHFSHCGPPRGPKSSWGSTRPRH